MALDQLFRSSSFWREWDFSGSGCSLSNTSLTSADSGCPSSSLSRLSRSSCSSSGSTPSLDLDYDCASWESSSFSSLPEDSNTDRWSRRLHFPSQRYQPSGIMPVFNIWSPCSEDDENLDTLSRRAKSEEDDSEPFSDWGCFTSWEKIPTPEEAEILHAQQVAMEKIKEEEAAARRAAKKEAQKQSYLNRLSRAVVAKKEAFIAKMRGDDDGATGTERKRTVDARVSRRHRHSGARRRPERNC